VGGGGLSVAAVVVVVIVVTLFFIKVPTTTARDVFCVGADVVAAVSSAFVRRTGLDIVVVKIRKRRREQV